MADEEKTQATPQQAQQQAPAPPPPPLADGEAAPPAEEEAKPKKKLSGVFSTQSIVKVGTGTTTRKTIQKTFWFVEETDKGDVDIQALNTNYVPSGPKKTISKDALLDGFSPEPEFYQQTVFPKMRELAQTISRADRHRKQGQLFSAEFEYQNALNVDEENVRANFGLGITYLERGETNKANDIFERLVKLDAAFDKEHKHLFNEFGINLRKNRMYDQALDYYGRAMELTEADEHLHYNMARAFFEKKELDKASGHLVKALNLNPGLDAARQFLSWLKEKNFYKGEIPGTPGAKKPEAKEPEQGRPAG